MSESTTQSFADRIVVGDHEFHSVQRNLKDLADGKVLVGQLRQVIENVSGSHLIIDVELLSVEWAFQFSIENESRGQRTHEEETELGMTVTRGSEVSQSVSASAGFSGWGFSAQVNGSTETKTFTNVETTSLKRVKDTYQCLPGDSIFVYKKKYTFKCTAWIYIEPQKAWLNYSDGKKVEGEFINEITSNQELVSPVALSSHGRITSVPPPGRLIPTQGFVLEAKLQGGSLRTWGRYSALVDDTSRANLVHGKAFLVEAREHEERLRLYEIDVYEVVWCTIDMDLGESVNGLTFRFIVDMMD